MSDLKANTTNWKILPPLLLLAVLALGCSNGGGNDDDGDAEVACVWNESAWDECEWG